MLKHAEVMLHNYSLVKEAQGLGAAAGGIPATPNAPWYSPEALQGLGQDIYGQASQMAGQVPGYLEHALSQAKGLGQDIYGQASQMASQIPGQFEQGLASAQESMAPISQKAMEILRSIPQFGGEAAQGAAQTAAGSVPPLG